MNPLGLGIDRCLGALPYFQEKQMCDVTFCLWHFKAEGTTATLGLLLGASPVSSLGRNFSFFSGCSIASLSFPPEGIFLLPDSFLLQVGPVPTYTAMEIVWFPLLAAAFYALHSCPLSFLGLPSCHQKSGLCPGWFLLILFASGACIS